MRSDVRVRHVMAAEHARLREIRLASLSTDPGAFGSTYAHELDYPVERWEQWAASSQEGASRRTFVATTAQDEWLGLSLVCLSEDDDEVAELFAMWVAPAARGRGTARVLCDACAAWAAARGCRALRLVVVAGNLSAMRAYQAAQFVTVGEKLWTRPDGVTQRHIVMTREL